MWGRKAFFKKFSSPPKKQSNLIIPLFLWHKRRKEKAWQKENAVIMGLLAPNPRKFFEKKSAVPTPNIVRSDIKILTFVPDGIEFLQYRTKNFQTLVQCEHCAFDR